MSKSMNLSALSIEQLTELQDKIPSVIAQKRTEKAQSALRQKLTELAGKENFKIARIELAPLQVVAAPVVKAKAAKSKGGVPIKFVNKDNSTETWTGRGRQPRWLAALIKSGHKLDEYRVGA